MPEHLRLTRPGDDPVEYSSWQFANPNGVIVNLSTSYDHDIGGGNFVFAGQALDPDGFIDTLNSVKRPTGASAS